MENVICNLCGADDYSILFSDTDLYADVETGPYRVVRCNKCGLAYLNPRVPESLIGGYYPDDIYLFKGRDKTGKAGILARMEGAYLFHGLKDHMKRVFKQASGIGLELRSVFDLGCGPGDRLSLYREKGLDVSGLEISNDAIYARKHYGLDVIQGTLDDYLKERKGDVYDLITCYNVLEHLYDPLESLSQLKTIISRDGMLVIMVPNLASVQASIFKGRWNFAELPRHLYFFTEETLTRMLNKAGYDILGVSTTSNFWHPPSIVLSIFPSLDPRFNWRDESAGSNSITAIFRRVFWGFATLALAPLAYAEGLIGRGALLSVYAVKVKT